MNTTLFFLRSSEQKIALNMLPHALSPCDTSDIYTSAYGLKSTDIGIYALTNNEISGAAWIRLFKESDEPAAYVDHVTPVLVIGVLPEARGNGIGTLIMEQLLQEAAVMYDQISVSVHTNSRAVNFYNRLGFVPLIDSEDNDIFTMVKQLDKKAVVRPTDGYDPRRWMD